MIWSFLILRVDHRLRNVFRLFLLLFFLLLLCIIFLTLLALLRLFIWSIVILDNCGITFIFIIFRFALTNDIHSFFVNFLLLFLWLRGFTTAVTIKINYLSVKVLITIVGIVHFLRFCLFLHKIISLNRRFTLYRTFWWIRRHGQLQHLLWFRFLLDLLERKLDLFVILFWITDDWLNIILHIIYHELVFV